MVTDNLVGAADGLYTYLGVWEPTQLSIDSNKGMNKSRLTACVLVTSAIAFRRFTPTSFQKISVFELPIREWNKGLLFSATALQATKEIFSISLGTDSGLRPSQKNLFPKHNIERYGYFAPTFLGREAASLPRKWTF